MTTTEHVHPGPLPRPLDRWREPRWDLGRAPRQDGRVAIVTGGNAGLGQEVVRGLAGLGAHVVIACRRPERGEAAAARVRAEVDGASVEVARLDLAGLTSVAAFADGVLTARDSLDLLVANAGIMAVDEGRTADGFELQVGTNHLGHVALTLRLLPLLLATPGSRVATMSSNGHRAGRIDPDDPTADPRGYDRWRAYARSKLANLLFTAELDRRLRAAGADTLALAAHPGAAATELGTEGSGRSNRVLRAIGSAVTQSPAAGALPMLRALTDPDAVGGAYYGPRLLGVGSPVREAPSRRARRADDARRLWEASERLTGVVSPV